MQVKEEVKDRRGKLRRWERGIARMEGRKKGNKKDGKTVTLAREKRKKDRKIYLIRWKERRQATRDERQIDSFII